jgi:NACalpha-BTF3-like transcription factor
MMDITSVGLQAPIGHAGNNVNDAVPGIRQTNGVARNADAENTNPPPESTRVTISDAGLARLEAERSGATGVQQESIPVVNGQVGNVAAAMPSLPPVTQTPAIASIEAVASAAVGQGATQAAGNVLTTAAPTAAEQGAVFSETPTPSAATVVGASNTLALAASSSSETSNTVRQAVEEVSQQVAARQSDGAAARQDVSLVAQGANVSRNALAA